MIWLRLVHGIPKEPSSSDWEALTSLPTANHFFEALFMACCGVDVRKTTITNKTEDAFYVRRVYGFQGTEDIGVRWVEIDDRESSIIPLYVETETYGLPGMTLHWSYSWSYAGQAGHAAFRHRSLLAQFEPGNAFEQFRSVWRQIFGVEPLFQPAPKPPVPIDEETK